ncbi:type III secretion system chaperone [Ramlibacter sp. AW1]|uniref:Type III secretion system chaperone n=1 Tax=Ramlibacter aurantiacus TaxID=2801330 RepID=A0A936ZMC4_9BURK|nr:type III secretion system chaperone [Ramlibacter aurantiacus]MBL0418811.1 type III secretion system chaperone [Ramlibacter aurantiacus]
MSPDQMNEVLAAHLGLSRLEPGDQGFSMPMEDGTPMELHLDAEREWLLLLAPIGDYPTGGTHGSYLGGLAGNLASARSGLPALVFDAANTTITARTVLWLPPLATGQLPELLTAFAASCRELRMHMQAALAEI